MNHENFNPFTPIYEQLDRMESMLADLLQRIEKRPRDRSIEMAMQITGYKRNTIYKLVNQRQLPHSKHRRKLFFDEEALKEWMKGKERLVVQEGKKVHFAVKDKRY